MKLNSIYISLCHKTRCVLLQQTNTASCVVVNLDRTPVPTYWDFFLGKHA